MVELFSILLPVCFNKFSVFRVTRDEERVLPVD